MINYKELDVKIKNIEGFCLSSPYGDGNSFGQPLGLKSIGFVKIETDLYTDKEKKLLTVKPGITDFASIVFNDEGEILSNSKDPDIDYNQLIRPWKSRLGLLYVNNINFILDIKLILYTVLSIFSKKKAIVFLIKDLKKIKANNKIIEVSKRVNKLVPYPPPGSNKIVERRG